MTRRLVASVVAIATLATGCSFSLFPDSAGNYSRYDDNGAEDVMLLLGLSSIMVAAIAGLIVVARNTGPSEEPAQNAAPPPPPPKEVVFAPMPTTAATEGDQLRLQRMYAQGELLARVGRCQSVITIGRVIAAEDPVYYAQFSAVPAVASCLAIPFTGSVDKLSPRN